MKISICMIVKDEAEHIAACLESLPSDVEVIIVDTGSTDNTNEILKAFNNIKLYSYKWENDFSKARNYSISLATGTHVLVLDADECLREDSYDKIVKHICNYPTTPAAVMIRNLDDGDEHSSVHRMIRLFPNEEKYRYFGAVHESLQANHAPASFIMSDVQIDHFGYNRTTYKEKKYNRYYRMYHEHLQGNPQDGYMWYQLGKLHSSVEEHEQACEAFIQASEYMKKPSLSHAAMIVEFSKVLKKIHLYEDAILLLENHRLLYDDYPDMMFQLGLLYMEVGNLDLISFSFKEAMKIGETGKYVTTIGVGSHLAAYNLGVFYELTGSRVEALKYYQMASAYEPAKLRLRAITKE